MKNIVILIGVVAVSFALQASDGVCSKNKAACDKSKAASCEKAKACACKKGETCVCDSAKGCACGKAKAEDKACCPRTKKA